MSERTIRFLPRLLLDFFFLFYNKCLGFNSSLLPSYGSGKYLTRVLQLCSWCRETLCQSTTGICCTPTNTFLLCSAPYLIQRSQPGVPVKQMVLSDTEERVVCVHSLNKLCVLCSTTPCCLVQVTFNRNISADFKVRFNCIQENMHLESL